MPHYNIIEDLLNLKNVLMNFKLVIIISFRLLNLIFLTYIMTIRATK